MNKVIATIFLVLSAAPKSQATEVTIDPSFQYSSLYGFDLIIDAAVDFSLSKHWQLGFGGVASVQNRDSKYEIYLGPTYNFSDRLERSFFLSFGGGYSNHYSYDFYDSSSDPESGFGFIDFGKRFLLSEKYQITYKPTIGARIGQSEVYLEGAIFSFSCLF